MTHSAQPSARHQSVGPASAALVIMTSALWGGTPVAIRFSAETLPPVAIAALRFALGALFMVVWCRCSGSGMILRRGQLRPALTCGIFLFVQISLFNIGVKLSNASHGSMLINTFIFYVVAIEHFVTRADRLTPRKLLGLLVAALGVALILSIAPSASGGGASEAPSLIGDVILVLSAMILGMKIVYTKHALKRVEAGKLILWHDLFGVFLFGAYSLLFENVADVNFTVPSALGILYQGIFVAGLCFAIQAALLRKHSASQISVFSFSTPLFGVTFAVLLRGDRLSPWLAVSALCVAVGIMLVTWNSRQNHD